MTTSPYPGPPSADDPLRELQAENARLRERLAQAEKRHVILAGIIGLLGIALGLLLPLLRPTQGEDSLWPLQAITLLPAAGGGPFRDEATIAGIAVGMYVGAIVLAFIFLFALLVSPSARKATLSLVFSIILLLGCAGAAMLALALSGQWDGRVSAFSPSALAAAIGAVFAIIVARIHPARKRT